MVMAAVGVFGVMSYAVNLRAREMGIRLALGARPSEVRRMVVIDGMKQALIGVVIGVAGAVWLTRHDDDAAVRRHAGRPADARHRGDDPARHGRARLLHPRAPRDESRSVDRPAD